MTLPPAIAYVALGANLDDPVRQVRTAIDALASLPGSRLLKVSSLYRTAPVGVVHQADFINAVAALETRETPHELLASLLRLEARFGRIRRGGVDPRTLDLDLLLHGDSVLADPALTLPHPRMHLRAFVLAPLLEIAPGCRIPGRGSAGAWWPAVAGQSIERLP